MIPVLQTQLDVLKNPTTDGSNINQRIGGVDGKRTAALATLITAAMGTLDSAYLQGKIDILNDPTTDASNLDIRIGGVDGKRDAMLALLLSVMGSSSGGIGGNVSAAPAGSVLVATGSGNNAQATGVTIDGSDNLTTGGDVHGGNLFSAAGGVILWDGRARMISPDAVTVKILDNTGAANGIIAASQGLFSLTDSDTNTIVTALTLTHATSATAAAGLGVAEAFQLPSDAGTLRQAGKISVVWGSALNGAESSGMTFTPMQSGAFVDVLSLFGTQAIFSFAHGGAALQDFGSVLSRCNGDGGFASQDQGGNVNHWSILKNGSNDMEIKVNSTLMLTLKTNGQVVFKTLPTSSAGLASGAFYTTAGAVMQA